MKGSSGRLALAIAIPLLVVPLAGLAWLAARSVDQQELEMRSRLRESLLLEVGQTNGRIGSWFADLPASLAADSPLAGSERKPTAAELEAWKARNPLVGVPFLLDSSLSIAYPDPSEASEENRLFYWRYLNVFGNVEPIPVYKNIASEYEASIVADSRADYLSETIASGTASPSSGPLPSVPAAEVLPLSMDTLADSSTLAESSVLAESSAPKSSPALESSEEEAAQPSAKKPLFGLFSKKSAESPDVRSSESSVAPVQAERDDADIVRSKVAQSIFETDAAVQKKVYDLAAGEGKETLTRNVSPVIDAVDTRSSAPARSVYIESDRYFRDLVAQADRGLVPRIFDNSFVLLFWEKKGDWIVGC